MPQEGKNTAVEGIYNIIKKQIITLQLLPGQILMVQVLSQQYDISRTPVREALVRLRDEGLVEETKGNKFRVSEITWKFILDIYDARISIEGTAVFSVAQNAAAEQIETLEQNHEDMKKALAESRFADYFDFDMRFHSLVLAHYGNSFFVDWGTRISDQQQRLRYLTTHISKRVENSLAEHGRILECIKMHDPVLAKEELEKHLNRARNDILSLKDSQHALFSSFIKE